MNILITGGAGYIGTELVYRLAKNDAVDKIVVFDNLSRGNYNLFLGEKPVKQKIKFIHGELLDSRNLKKALEGIDVVYHLAAKVTTPFANVDAHFFEQINHWGTADLVYALEESKVKQLIFTSSSSVYGTSHDEVNEDSIPNPSSFYGISKLRAEEHVRRLSESMNTLILRCGNVYGYSKSMRFDAAINKFMFDANFHNRITIDGNGNQFRSFIHIDKVSQILENILFKEVPSGTYNMSDKNLEVNEIVNLIRKIFPDLEFQFINQHIQMLELRVNPASKLYQYFPLPESDFKDELQRFKERFSFFSV